MNSDIEWDEDKNQLNLRNHPGISFEEAQTVFLDEYCLVLPDDPHSFGERRYNALGSSGAGRLLVVTYTERWQKLRIISARGPTKRERRTYEEG